MLNFFASELYIYMCVFLDHWINVLECRQQCADEMATINGAVVQDFLVEHYNYLQFAYFKG